MASVDGDLIGTDVNGWIDAAGNTLAIFENDGVGGERRRKSREKSRGKNGSDEQEIRQALAHGGMLGQLSALKWETHGASSAFVVVSLGVSFGASFGKSMRTALPAGPPTGAKRP